MNLQKLFAGMKPKRPFILGKGKPNKYNKTAMDGHKVLGSGAIVVRTLSVGGKEVDAKYDEAAIKEYRKLVKANA